VLGGGNHPGFVLGHLLALSSVENWKIMTLMSLLLLVVVAALHKRMTMPSMDEMRRRRRRGCYYTVKSKKIMPEGIVEARSGRR